jgi:hypothetical protein
MAEMLTDYFHHDARFEIESVEYCDDALACFNVSGLT